MIQQKLNIIGAFMRDQFVKELMEQDHNATGDLIKSIKYEVKKSSDGWAILFTALDYGLFVETGTKPHKIPIAVLMEWIINKGIASGEKDVKNAAFAIQRKIMQEGTPTKGSYKFSKNGRRTEWITYTVEKNTVKIGEELLLLFGAEITSKLNNIINKANGTNF